MSATSPLQPPGERVKKALSHFAELRRKYPERTRRELLNEVEIQFDLTPLECEFLHKHFGDFSS